MEKRTGYGILIICLTLLVSCSTGARLRTANIGTEVPEAGIYDVIIYTSGHYSGLENVVFLDISDDSIRIEPAAPEFEYSIKRNLPAKEAVESATHFLSMSKDFQRVEVRKIFDLKGSLVGFEFRPLYRPFVYGKLDVLDISYWHKEDNRILARITLDEQIEALLERRDAY